MTENYISSLPKGTILPMNADTGANKVSHHLVPTASNKLTL
jgi:hypothetical protein